MSGKAMVMSSEAMGTREFKYASGVTQEPDGSYTLRIASVGPKSSHCMPPPPPIKGPDLETLAAESKAFLQEWAKVQPENKSHQLCCTKVVENAIARAKKTAARNGAPIVRRG